MYTVSAFEYVLGFRIQACSAQGVESLEPDQRVSTKLDDPSPEGLGSRVQGLVSETQH